MNLSITELIAALYGRVIGQPVFVCRVENGEASFLRMRAVGVVVVADQPHLLVDAHHRMFNTPSAIPVLLNRVTWRRAEIPDVLTRLLMEEQTRLSESTLRAIDRLEEMSDDTLNSNS